MLKTNSWNQGSSFSWGNIYINLFDLAQRNWIKTHSNVRIEGSNQAEIMPFQLHMLTFILSYSKIRAVLELKHCLTRSKLQFELLCSCKDTVMLKCQVLTIHINWIIGTALIFPSSKMHYNVNNVRRAIWNTCTEFNWFTEIIQLKRTTAPC